MFTPAGDEPALGTVMQAKFLRTRARLAQSEMTGIRPDIPAFSRIPSRFGSLSMGRARGAGDVVRDFAMKLRLAAVVLGCTTRKDLAAAFRGINPATTFDVERADKWLGDKALPRGSDVYRDWSRLLALDRPFEWLASCSGDELLAALVERDGMAPDLLLERARDFPHGARRQPAPRSAGSGTGYVEGAYACYSYSFSPYFPGWLIRSSMVIGPGHGQGSVAYSHNMPPLPTRFSGDITFNGRGMQIALHQTAVGDMRIYMALFGPAPPATVLAGMLCGAAVVTPEPEPSAARIILIRLPAPSPAFDALYTAFQPEQSIADDLALAGLRFSDPAEVDRRIKEYLPARPRNGIEQVATEEYRELVEYFNREHYAHVAALRTGPPEGTAGAAT
jgi:hypothetical protein